MRAPGGRWLAASLVLAAMVATAEMSLDVRRTAVPEPGSRADVLLTWGDRPQVVTVAVGEDVHADHQGRAVLSAAVVPQCRAPSRPCRDLSDFHSVIDVVAY